MTAAPPRPRRPGLRPLSRRASRVFVIGLLALVLALAVAGSLYLVRSAEEARQRLEQPESPSTPEALPADSVSG